MKTRTTAACLALFALCGCTGIQPPLADLEGKDQSQFNQDFAACQQDAPIITVSTWLDDCMTDKGWKLLGQTS